jgi:hypothetical protein
MGDNVVPPCCTALGLMRRLELSFAAAKQRVLTLPAMDGIAGNVGYRHRRVSFDWGDARCWPTEVDP